MSHSPTLPLTSFSSSAMASFFRILAMLIFSSVLVAGIFSRPAMAADNRAFFVFGDSLVDYGNNNYLATTARADAPPYGIDYPTHTPTGRFSNGLNMPDLISEYFGLQTVLAYLDPNLKGNKLLHGANFASAGVGILNDTGIQFVNIIRIYQQLQYFEEYQQRVSQIIGKEKTSKLINEALVLITLGGNDFVNNYYLIPFSLRSQQYDLPTYCTLLISEYEKILMRLYELGPRRVIVTGTGPLGCVPAELALHSSQGECAAELQRAASIFNPSLSKMLTHLNHKIGKNVFIGANTDRVHMDFISNPKAFGFETSKIACCGQGPYNGLGLCTPLSNLCSNRDKYVFWDPFHPTERANRLIVQIMMNGTEKYMNPMNLSTIKAMDTRN